MDRWKQLSANERTLLDHVFWSSGISREALATGTAFSKSRANAAVAGMLELGVLEPTGEQRATGGRRAGTLRLSRALGVLVGVALGATGLEVGVLAPDLELLAHHSEPADVRDGPGVVLSRVRSLMRELLEQAGARAHDVIAVGIGVPGPVDFGLGQLVNPPLMPEWDAYSIRDDLRADFAAPVFVDNDVNVMALGELWRMQRGLQNFLVVKVGTGIGCGIVCHGQVYRGANGSAGDVGHICVDPAGPRCHCGNHGCVEAIAGEAAIARQIQEATGVELVDAAQALTMAREGVPGAREVYARAGEAIGRGIATVANLLGPERVIISGEGLAAYDLFAEHIRAAFTAAAFGSAAECDVQTRPLPFEEWARGAAATAIQSFVRADT
jgi:predicted NBD/HSP70 family sugar kinase